MKHSIVDGPGNILTQLRLLRGQSKEVVDIVGPYVRTGAWFAHPEALLLSLMASQSKLDREFAVGKILQLRGTADRGDSTVRSRRTPFLRFEASNLMEIIDWEKDTIYEPNFTCSLSNDAIKAIVDVPLEVGYYPCHTQSTERVVKQVVIIFNFCVVYLFV